MIILGIESSCDETAAAIVEDGKKVLSSIVATQIEEHKKFGGVVPELASRRHSENILAVVEEAITKANIILDDVDAVAVTYAPGLIGALLVGVNFAKGLAYSIKKPLIPVHHIAGHIASNYVCNPELKPPYICLVISGGHSHIIEVEDYTKFKLIGRTRDDAAGECFDKCARALGFPYPGGVHIDKASKQGDHTKYVLPKPRVSGNEFDFSFSGIKTAVINIIHNSEQKKIEIDKYALAASLQKNISEILVEKTIMAAKKFNMNKIVIAGGVSANSGVRNEMEVKCKENNMELYMPDLYLCGDNAIMIAVQGYYDYLNGTIADESLNAVATLSIENL